MSDQRNLITAIAVSILILIGYQYFFELPKQKAEQEKQRQELTQKKSKDGVTTPTPGSSTPTSQVDLLKQLDPTAARASAIKKSPRISIENSRLSGSIALVGARMDDLALKGYRETVAKDSPDVELFSPLGSAKPYYALFGWTPVAGLNVKVPDANTVWSADKKILRNGQPLTLTWDNGAGLTFIRKIALDKNYLFTITQSVINKTNKPVTLHPYGLITRTGTPESSGLYILHEGPLGVFNDVLEELDYDDLEDGDQKFSSTGGWIGLTDKYWLVALAPDGNKNFTGHFRRIAPAGKVEKYQTDFLRDPVQIEVGATLAVTNRLFAGAKEVELLENYRDNLNINKLDLAIDFGVLYFMTKPLFKVLAYFYAHIGNFGVAILLLTFCLRILLYPLANKGYKSMNRMKLLQPKMQELKERYGEDKPKMQKELMALYKKEKVNPAAGCLPILVQIPIFFALYKVLLVTIEMRHAPFFGWIQDLSAPDPTTLFNLFGLVPWTPPDFMMIGVWPIAMGLSMFLQQKLNPAPTDPIQAKIFLFMPLFFTFLLASFPAGLVVYWTCNNTLSMGQQWLIKKRMAANDAKPTVPAKVKAEPEKKSKKDKKKT